VPHPANANLDGKNLFWGPLLKDARFLALLGDPKSNAPIQR
jgi:hypothetical protein